MEWYNIPTFVNYRNRNNKLLPKFTGKYFGNSILSDSGGILNVSGQEYSLQVLQQMGLNSQNRLFCLQVVTLIILDI
jgi:hypothetical protein